MVNRSDDREASRDFVALFVLDPSAKPLTPARRVLAGAHLLRRTLAARGADGGPSRCPAPARKLVLEFLGAETSEEALRRRRLVLLGRQLRPRGRFGHDDRVVYSTGNGCFTMIGWLQEMCRPGGRDGWRCVDGLNLPAVGMGRGASEVLSLSSGALSARLKRRPGAGDALGASDASAGDGD